MRGSRPPRVADHSCRHGTAQEKNPPNQRGTPREPGAYQKGYYRVSKCGGLRGRGAHPDTPRAAWGPDLPSLADCALSVVSWEHPIEEEETQ